MSGPFVHRIDPVIAGLGGVYLWWYGLSFTLGFLGVHLFLRRNRGRLGMTLHEVYGVTLHLAIGVLLGGRFVEVVFYEWDYYSRHVLQIPAYWLGGMATHGLLIGAVAGTFVFCRRYGRSFLQTADALAIPAAWVLAMGRVGNFIDGQITGALSEAWWAVRFPDAEGFRHPVVLYDGLKNLLLIPFLLVLRGRRPRAGIVFAHFVLWYAFLRIFIDVFREYRTQSLGLPTGQLLNIGMAVIGLILLVWCHQQARRQAPAPVLESSLGLETRKPFALQQALLVILLLLCPVIPSDWTQDIPARYGHRHPGLQHSLLYPTVERG